MSKTFLAQIICVFAIIFWVASIQNKKQKDILIMQALANLAYAIQYIILGSFVAASMNVTSFIRGYIFSKKRAKNQDISLLWLLLFIGIIVILGILTCDGLLSLIPVIITIFYTISSWFKNPLWNRIVFLLAAFVWIYYNYKIGAYVCIVGNIFEIISGITALVRFSKPKKIKQ